MRLRKTDRIKAALFMSPGLLLFLFFFILPVGFVFVFSLFEWNGVTPPIFDGLTNFQKIFKDKVFWTSLRNNVIWALAQGFIQVPMALVVALILSQKIKGWKFFRTIYFLPQVMSTIALAKLWQAVYNREFGLLNGLLRLVGLEEYQKNWLGDPDTALISVVIYGLFYIGYYMVIMMADITNIDETFYEAARIDGANRFQMDIHITIPLIRGSILTCITLAMIFGLRTFEQVYLLTNGGPANRTSTLVLYLYDQININRYGTSNASSVMLILTGAVTIIVIRNLFVRATRRYE